MARNRSTVATAFVALMLALLLAGCQAEPQISGTAEPRATAVPPSFTPAQPTSTTDTTASVDLTTLPATRGSVTFTPQPVANAPITPPAEMSADLVLLSPSPAPGPTLNPAGIVGLGAYLQGTPYDGFAATREFELNIGRKMAYALWFQAWGDGDREFPAIWIEMSAQDGLTPVITWEPWARDFANPTADQSAYSLESIADGRHDAYIREWAHGVRDAGVTVIIRFAHEASTEPGTRGWYPWQGDPHSYQIAFRHIVDLFRAEGAGNARFMWSAMWLDAWAEQYYPGDTYVDYVGTTVLNHGSAPDVPWAAWRSFGELFGEQYRAGLAWGKPIFLTELGTAEQGGDKAAWLRECFGSLATDYPLVIGVLLLEVTSDREWPQINWSVTSSVAALSAFLESIDSPHFR